MLQFEGLNYLAIVAAWIINCAVGSWWYSPAGFGKQWKKHTGVDLLKMPMKDATNAIVAVIISGMVQAIALAVALKSLNVESATDGLLVSLFLWLGFVTATTVGTALYSRRNWKFIWLNSSYFLVVMAINSVILAVWK